MNENTVVIQHHGNTTLATGLSSLYRTSQKKISFLLFKGNQRTGQEFSDTIPPFHKKKSRPEEESNLPCEGPRVGLHRRLYVGDKTSCHQRVF